MRLRAYGSALLLSLLASVSAYAQGPTRVQQDPAMLNASIGVQHSHTSATTLTIPAIAGQYIYVTGVDIANCAGASAVVAAAPTFMTVTNLAGAPQYMIGSGVTAGLCQPPPSATAVGGFPLKSAAPGTAVTFVLPAFATNQSVSVNVYYYYGNGQ